MLWKWAKVILFLAAGVAFAGEFPLLLPEGQTLRVTLAVTEEEQARGLSGVRARDFPKDRGMLFLYPRDGLRSFWMPDTHFDLAIVFLDQNLRVVAVENPVPKHPGRKEPIPRTGRYLCRHVLELRADSPLARQMIKGARLAVPAPFVLPAALGRTKPKTRPGR